MNQSNLRASPRRSVKQSFSTHQQVVVDEFELNLNVELPHDVMVSTIPNMGDVMNTWKIGV